MANTFKKVWRDKKFRMHAVWQPSGAAGPKLVRYPEKSFKMRETLLLFHSKLKTVRLKVFAELVIHCHPSDAAPHSEKAGLIPGAPKTHTQSHGDNKEIFCLFLLFLPLPAFTWPHCFSVSALQLFNERNLFTRISGSDVTEFYPFCISPHPHIKISAMPIAAIVDLAPMSDLLPILDIDDVSYTRVQEGQRRGAARGESTSI